MLNDTLNTTFYEYNNDEVAKKHPRFIQDAMEGVDEVQEEYAYLLEPESGEFVEEPADALLSNADEAETMDLNDLEAADLTGIETDDMFKMYITEAARVPLLKASEEVELAQRIERGRLAQQELGKGNVRPARLAQLRRLIEDGHCAQERLIQANALLVVSVAKKYLGRGMPFMDLIQEGNIGLMRAAKKFDHRRGFKFSTYATWWIRQAVTRALADQSRTIRLPAYMNDMVNRALRTQHQLQQTLGRAPSTVELAQALEMTPARVEEMLKTVQQPLSLQMTINDENDDALGDLIEDTTSPNPEDKALQTLLSEDLQDVLATLPPRELKVLQMRYGLDSDDPMTLAEVGKKLGISRERARQIETQALSRLRKPTVRRKLNAYTD